MCASLAHDHEDEAKGIEPSPSGRISSAPRARSSGGWFAIIVSISAATTSAAARGAASAEWVSRRVMPCPFCPRPPPESLVPQPKFREGALLVRLRGDRVRDAEARRLALRANRAQFGAYTCEACGYRPGEDTRVPRGRASSMLDVHHVEPLAGGARDTTLDRLAVICPLCHRRHHVAEAAAAAERQETRSSG